MRKKFKIGNLNINLGCEHYWQGNMERMLYFKIKYLGLGFSKTRSIGSKKRGKGMFDDDNHVPTYKLSINLIWVRLWISIVIGDIMIFGDK